MNAKEQQRPSFSRSEKYLDIGNANDERRMTGSVAADSKMECFGDGANRCLCQERVDK
jgi:hypothetical protein